MTKITSKIFTSVATLFLITACSNSSGIKGVAEPPTVSVHNVSLERLTWQGGDANFTLNVTNPNPYPLPLSGFDYGLSLNGVEVANGNQEQTMMLNARQTQQVNVPLKLSFVNIASVLPGLIRQGTINYQLAGSVHLTLLNIPFKRSGTTQLR